MRSIVVGVDESPGAANALRWAANERALHDCTLTAVLCWSYLEQHRAERDHPFDPAYDSADAGAALDAIVEAVLGGDAIQVRRETVNDLPARGLLESSVGADLLVVGARGLGTLRGLLGSVSRQCLHHSENPVAVVHSRTAGHPATVASGSGHILVAVDGSATAQRALDWALAEARRRRAAVTVLHTWTPPYVGGVFVPAVVYDPTAIEQTAVAVLDAAVDAADTSDLTGSIDERVACGAAGRTIVDVAAEVDADLLVVGSRGLGGFKGLLLGSVSDHVASHAAGPVVVIPHAG